MSGCPCHNYTMANDAFVLCVFLSMPSTIIFIKHTRKERRRRREHNIRRVMHVYRRKRLPCAAANKHCKCYAFAKEKCRIGCRRRSRQPTSFVVAVKVQKVYFCHFSLLFFFDKIFFFSLLLLQLYAEFVLLLSFN